MLAKLGSDYTEDLKASSFSSTSVDINIINTFSLAEAFSY